MNPIINNRTLQKELIEALLEKFVVSEGKVPSLIKELHKLCDKSDTNDAFKSLTKASFERLQAIEAPKEKLVLQLDKQLIGSFRRFQFLIFQAASRSSDKDDSFPLPALAEMIKALRKDDKTGISQSLIRSLCSLPYFVGIEEHLPSDDSDLTDFQTSALQLSSMVQFVAKQGNDLTSTLLLLLYVLFLLNGNGGTFRKEDICFVGDGIMDCLARPITVGEKEIKEFKEAERQSAKCRTLLSSPRIVLESGNPGKLSRMEVQGKASGFLSGIHVTSGDGFAYFEVHLKGSCADGVRIGWSRCGSSLVTVGLGGDASTILPGESPDEWVLELCSGLVYHNSIAKKAERVAESAQIDWNLRSMSMEDTLQLQEKMQSEELGNVTTEESDEMTVAELFGDSASGQQQIQVSSPALPRNIPIEGNPEAYEDITVTDGYINDPNLFFFPDRRNRSYLRLVKLGFDLMSIRRMILRDGLVIDDLSGLLSALRDGGRLGREQSMGNNQHHVTRRNPEAEGGDSIWKVQSEQAVIPWANDDTVGCLLNRRTGEIVFYRNGTAIGDFCPNFVNWGSTVALRPVFLCSSSAGLSFNVGQGAFRFIPSELSSKDSASQQLPFEIRENEALLATVSAIDVISSQRLITVVIDTKNSSCENLSEILPSSRLLFGGWITLNPVVSKASDGKFNLKFSYEKVPESFAAQSAKFVLYESLSSCYQFDPMDFIDRCDTVKSPPRVNRVGIPVAPGTDKCTLYCGRDLGVREIPRSDGRCGPTNGPQCNDCKGLLVVSPRCNNGHELEVMTSRPKDYSGATMCDLCNLRSIDSLGKHFYHCAACGFDMCPSCAVQVAKLTLAQTPSEEPIQTTINNDEIGKQPLCSHSLFGFYKSSFLRIGEIKTERTDKGCIVYERISSSIAGNLTIETTMLLDLNDETTAIIPIANFFMTTVSRGISSALLLALILCPSGHIMIELNQKEAFRTAAPVISSIKDWFQLSVVLNTDAEESVSIFVDGVLRERAILSQDKSFRIVANTRIVKLVIGPDFDDIIVGAAESFWMRQSREDETVQAIPSYQHGRWNSVSAGYCLGDFRVWSSSRTASQISSSLGREDVIPVDSRLLVFLPFEEGAGKHIHDCSGKNASGNRALVSIHGEAVWGEHAGSSPEVILRYKLERYSNLKNDTAAPRSLDALLGALDDRLRLMLTAIEEGGISEKDCLYVDKVVFNLDRSVIDPSRVNFELLVNLLQNVFRLVTELPPDNLEGSKVCDVAVHLLRILKLNLLAVRKFDLDVAKVLGWNISSYPSSLSRQIVFLLIRSIELRNKHPMFVPFASNAVAILIQEFNVFLPSPTAKRSFLKCLVGSSLNENSNDTDNALVALLMNCNPDVLAYLSCHIFTWLSRDSIICKIIPGCINPGLDSSNSWRQAEIEFGDEVEKEANWCYGDLQGGEQHGFVIGVEDWIGGKGKSVMVMWENGSCNEYRWKVEEVVNHTTHIRTDIHSISAEGLNINAHASSNSLAEKKSLIFRPDEVEKLFSSELGSDYLVEILEYMRLTAGSSWLSEHNLTLPVDLAIKIVSTDEVIRLYADFYGTYSDEIIEISKPTRNMEDDVSSFSAILTSLLRIVSAWQSDVAMSELQESAFALLRTIQYFITGNKSDSEFSGTKFCELSFDSGSGLSWNWEEAIWEKASENCSEIPCATSLERRNEVSARDLFLSSLKFSNWSPFCTTKNQDTTIVQNANRQWATSMGNIAMYPNSGVYRWCFVVERIGSRRCHCMFGVGTEKTDLGSYLGHDSESWGINANNEIFHNSNRASDFAFNLEINNAIEMIFDSDEGTLSIKNLLHDDSPLLAFSGLDGLVLFPAWSLYAQSDTISIISVKTERSESTGNVSKSEKESTKVNALNNFSSFGTAHESVIVMCETLCQNVCNHIRATGSLRSCIFVDNLLHVVASLCQWKKIHHSNAMRLIPTLNDVLIRCFPILKHERERNAQDNQIKLRAVASLLLQISFFVGKLYYSWVDVQDCLTPNKLVASYLLSDFDGSQHTPPWSVYSKVMTQDPTPWLKFPAISKGLSTQNVSLFLSRASNFFNCTEGSKERQVMEWIEKHEAKKNSAPFLLATDCTSKGIRQFFIAVVYHAGYFGLVETMLSVLSDGSQKEVLDRRPPWFLMACWESAISLRTAVSKEVQLTFATHEEVVGRLLPRINFLFELASHNDFHSISSCGADMLQFLQIVQAERPKTLQSGKEISEAASFAYSFVNSEFSFSLLRAILRNSSTQCARRRDGFRSLQATACLLEHLGSGVRCALLQPLHGALEKVDSYNLDGTSETSPVHHNFGLEGCSDLEKLSLRGSFESMLSYFVSELVSSNTNGSISLMLVLLNSLGLILCNNEHIFLSRVNIFLVLHEILETYSSLDDEQGSPSSAISGTVTQAAMKLFTILALQVASSNDGEISKVASKLNEIRSISRSKSGPRTLGTNVFDVLLKQLRRIVGILDANVFPGGASSGNHTQPIVFRTNLSADASAVLSEITSLLLCLSIDEGCRNILSRGIWISMLLDVALLGQSTSKIDCLQILGNLLPNLDPGAIDIEPSRICVKFLDQLIPRNEFSGGKLVLVFLMAICVPLLHRNYIHLGTSSTVEELKESLNESRADQCECVALLRSLFNSPIWKPLVEDSFNDAFSKFQTDALSGTVDQTTTPSHLWMTISALAILGGHVDLPYERSPVFVASGGTETMFGVILETPLESSGYYTVEVASYLEGHLFEDTLVRSRKQVSSEDVRPVNRVPLGTLDISIGLLGALMKLLESLLLKKLDAKNGILTPSIYQVICSVASRAFSSLVSISRIADIVCEILSGSTSSGWKLFLRALLTHASKVTSSTGLVAIPSIEDIVGSMSSQKEAHLLMALLESGKIVTGKCSDSRDDEAKDVAVNPIVDAVFDDGKDGSNLIARSTSDDSSIPAAESTPAKAPPPTPLLSSPEPERLVGSNESSSRSSPSSSSRPLLFSTSTANQDSDLHRESLASDVSQEHEQREHGAASHDSMMETLLSMGFPKPWCEAALSMSQDFDEAVNNLLLRGPELINMAAGNENPVSEVDQEHFDWESEEVSPLEAKETNSWISVEGVHSPGAAASSTTVQYPQGTFLKTSYESCPKEYHYDSTQDSLLPFFSEPSDSSDRWGCIFPGDDVWVHQELADVNNPTNCWLMIRVCDYDDESVEYVEDSNTDFQETFAWVPMFVEGTKVILKGSEEGGCAHVSHPKARSISVNASFSVRSSQDIIVRENMEQGSNEIGTISPGEIIYITQEAFNTDGILCLEVASPFHGWVSKYVSVFNKLESRSLNEPLPSQNDEQHQEINMASPLSEWDRLERLEDNMEQCDSVDMYRRECRYFQSMQGNAFKRVNRDAFCNKSTRGFVRSRDSNIPLNQLDDLLGPHFDRLSNLHCRKAFLGLCLRSMYRDGVRLEGSHLKGHQLPSILLTLIGSESAENFASMMVSFVKLVTFRGNPYYCSGLEHLLFDDIGFAMLGNNNVSTDMALSPLLYTLLVCQQFDSNHAAVFKSVVREELINAVVVALTETRHGEQWVNDSYVDDSDSDAAGLVNLHFAIWVSKAAASVQSGSVDLISRIFRILSLGGLKSSAMSLKNVAFEMLSMLLTQLRRQSTEDTSSCPARLSLERCMQSIPLERLTALASKRLWSEMEDDPAYSRFIQSLLQLLTECKLASDLLKAKVAAHISPMQATIIAEDGNVSIRPYLTMDGVKSFVALAPAKDISGPWTFECWIRCRGDSRESLMLKQQAISSEQKENRPTGNSTISRESPLLERIRLAREDSEQPRETLDTVAHLFSGLRRAIEAEESARSSPSRGLLDTSSQKQSKNNNNEVLIAGEDAVNEDATRNFGENFVVPMYLLSSPNGAVKLRAGGKTFSDDLEDNLQDVDPVADRSTMISIVNKDGVETCFDYVLPTNVWTHFALVSSGSPTHKISLLVNGEVCDQINSKFSLPLAVIGTMKQGLSFTGDLMEFRIWGSARTSSEIARDMNLDVSEARGLISHFKVLEGSGVRITDSAGLFGSCLVHGCTWSADLAPRLKTLPSPYFLLSEPEERSGIFGESVGRSVGVIEMCGVLSLKAVKGALGKWSQDRTEVISLVFRVRNNVSGPPEESASVRQESETVGEEQVEGYIDWSEQGIRSELEDGWIGPNGAFRFRIGSSKTLLGPQELVDWSGDIMFTGSLDEGKMEGSMCFEAIVPFTPPLKPGEVVVDTEELPSSLDYTLNGQKGSHISLKEDARRGLYLTTLKLRAHISPGVSTSVSDGRAALSPVSSMEILAPTLEPETEETSVDLLSPPEIRSEVGEETQKEEDLPFGLRAGCGSLWVEWQVVSSRSSVIFGVCGKAFAEDHKNGSSREQQIFDANAVAYHQSGLITHVPQKTERAKYRDGDFIGIQMNSILGFVAFYKNNELVQLCEDIHNSNLLMGDGLRPFVAMTRGNDEVIFRGTKEGTSTITYPLNACIDNRKSITGSIQNGTFNGVCSIHFHDQKGYWFGSWKNGKREGAQIWIASSEETSQSSVDRICSVAVFENDVETFRIEDVENLPEDGEREKRLKISLEMLKHAFEEFLKSSSKQSSEKPQEPAEASDLKSTPPSKKHGNEDSSHITIHLHDGQGHDLHFKVSKSIKMKKVFDVFGMKKKLNVRSVCFYFNSKRISEDATPESLDMKDNDKITVSPFEPVLASSTATVNELIENSTARFILEAVLPTGATVRSGVEIEENSPVRLLVQHEVVEAFDFARTREGIGRFKIADGWISERLRGGAEDTVVHVLRELFPVPIRYKVLREGGAKVRAGASLASDPKGFCPQGTEVEVAETRRISAQVPGEEDTIRLRIKSPVEWAGWVSGKPHILSRLPDSQQLLPLETKQSSEAEAERARRAEIRSRRKIRRLESAEKQFSKIRTISGSVELDQENFFLLNGQNKPQGVNLSSDRRTVTCEGRGAGRVLAYGTRGFTRGVHYWEVQVDAASWGSVFIGVAPAEASNWGGYGFLNYRATQAFGNETLYGSYYTANDTVGVLLDMDHGTISFIKDGENLGRTVVINMGVAYHNLRRHCSSRSSSCILYPCFGVKSSGDQLSIRRRKWVSTRGLSPASLLEQVLCAKLVISRWRGAYFEQASQSLPVDLIEEMYGAYVRWRGHDKKLVKSRAGIEVAIDASKTAVNEVVGSLKDTFSIYPGCKFSSLYGDGSVLGARNGKLWFQLDTGENGAWYWSIDELIDLVNMGTVCFKPREGEPALESESCSESAGLPTSPVQLLSLQEFKTCITTPRWTLEEDEIITSCANVVADKFGYDNLLIPGDVLEEFRQQRNLLPSRNAPQIQARYAALCVLNRAVGVAAPLADVGCREKRLPLVYTSNYGRLLQDEDMIVLRKSSTLARSASGIEVLDLKRVIFTRTKLALWDRALTETTTPTGAPPDEFERPEDLAELRINRPEALNVDYAKSSLNERLRKTIFGQTMEQLKSFEDKALRRSFVHIEDAGQKRAFFVKFVGEGVDDHGGPYRALFESAVGEEPAGMLELLVPCPNGRNEVGENRDKMVLNPDYLWQPERLGLYNHLGKLAAIACRHKILVPLTLSSLIWKPLAGEEIVADDLEAIDFSILKNLRSLSKSDPVPQENVELIIDALLASWALPSARDDVKSDSSRSDNVDHSNYATLLATCVVTGKSKRLLDACAETSDGLTTAQTQVKRICDLILQRRMTSHLEGIEQLYAGMSAVIPTELLSMFTENEVEKLFCGENDVNIDLLKEATIYDCVQPTDSHIQFFWRAVEIMSPEERSQLINFCSGRSRLPSSIREFPMLFKLGLPPPQSQKDPDNYLPIAQTCFFSLSLPRYTTFEACLEKLRYAIKNTQLMDADFAMRNAEGWQNV